MIKSLPKSLIATADEILRQHILPSSNNMVSNYFCAPLYNMGSVHADSRRHGISIDIGDLCEGVVDSFRNWISDTEPMGNRLPIESYITPTDSDSNQLSTRGMSLPESHPELAKSHIGSLGDADTNAIHDFVHIGLRQIPPYSSGSKRINVHLKGAADHQASPQPHIMHHNGESFSLHAMDTALRKNKLKEKLTTYSGIDFNPSTKMNQYGLVNSPVYLSSSTRKFTAAKYAIDHSDNDGVHHILAIHHDIGDHGIYIGNRNKLTSFSDDEYIMPRNITLKIHPDFSEYHSFRDGRRSVFRVWQAERHTTKPYND